MTYDDYHTAEQLHKLRQAEIDRAIRLGLHVKYDEMKKPTKARRIVFLHTLLHFVKLVKRIHLRFNKRRNKIL
ncbi:hypothetical protein PCCS19_29870 [Paenibacillus sp. CCS19]|nr:hypothetical protein PCCS19_29870 [Paenibacillus cellulosilyticus]